MLPRKCFRKGRFSSDSRDPHGIPYGAIGSSVDRLRKPPDGHKAIGKSSAMRMSGWRHSVRGTHDQAAMPDSLGADEFVSQLLDIAGPAAQDHHFKAGIVIEVSMKRRDHNLVMLMLKVGKFFRQKASVMIID